MLGITGASRSHQVGHQGSRGGIEVAPHPLIITPDPGRIHQAGLPTPTTLGPGLLVQLLLVVVVQLVQLGFLQAPRLCGASSTRRSPLLR